MNIATNIRQEVGPQGHISVISHDLAAWLNRLYLPRFDDASTFDSGNGQRRRVAKTHVRAEMFPPLTSREYKPEEVDCRFSFLLGCHFRYGQNNSFSLANATHKVELLIGFLEQLGVSWIRWSWTTKTAPRTNMIEFGPDSVLAKLFRLSGEFSLGELGPCSTVRTDPANRP